MNHDRVSRLEADRILRRAAELDGARDSDPLTVDELRAIAGEAGLASRAVERAIAEAQSGSVPGAAPTPVQRWGLVIVHLSAIRQIPVGLDADQLLKLVRLFQPYREGPAEVRLEEHEISWRDDKGLRFAVTSVGGVTEVRVYVAKILLRRTRWTEWVRSASDRLERLAVLLGQASSPPPAPTPLLRGEDAPHQR